MNRKMKDFCKKKLEDRDYCRVIPYYKIFYPITVLLGPNGCGKTTTLRKIEEDLKETEAVVITYSTTNNDIVKVAGNPFNFRPESLISAFHSEGERMTDSFYDWEEKVMLPAILSNKYSNLYILIDEADSGLSLDNIYLHFEDIKFIINAEVNRGRKIHLIISANSYELASVFKGMDPGLVDYLWVPTEESILLGSYNKYRKRYFEYYRRMNFDETGKRRS